LRASSAAILIGSTRDMPSADMGSPFWEISISVTALRFHLSDLLDEEIKKGKE
jgi:hypothetical protein